MTGRLAEVLEANETGGALGGIRKHLLKKAADPGDRRQDVIHPSEMAQHDWCPRRTYYRIRDVRAGRELKAEQHAIGTLQIFEEGHALHRKYQGLLREMGVLKGRWDCVECDTKGVAWPDDPGRCPLCGSKSGVVYGEVPLDAIAELLIGGHADGWVEPGLIEIKSIGKGTLRIDDPELLEKYTFYVPEIRKKLTDLDGLWADLSRPLRSHIKQANIYLFIATRYMNVPVDRMEFIYEFKANQQTKSFTIKLSPKVINPLLEKAATVREALDTGIPPEREFTKKNQKPCKNCAWLDECWKVADAQDSPEPESTGGGKRSSRRSEGVGRARRVVRTRAARRQAEQDPPRHHRARRPRADGVVQRNDRVGQLSRVEARRSPN